MYLLCKCVWGVLLGQLAFGLEQNSPPVIMLIYYMYSDATLLLMVGYHSFVNMMAIHSFASIIWKQGRMYINNVVGKCV